MTDMGSSTEKRAVQLSERSSGQVVLTTEDFDRFVMTQRDIVDACRGHTNFLAKSREMAEEMHRTIADINAWCLAHNDSVANCAACPRADDMLILVTAKNEDDGGHLHDDMCALDLELFNRNKFRLYWLLLRASEASGADAFLNPDACRTIYSANSATAPSGRR
jgi:hypothetical protein